MEKRVYYQAIRYYYYGGGRSRVVATSMREYKSRKQAMRAQAKCLRALAERGTLVELPHNAYAYDVASTIYPPM